MLLKATSFKYEHVSLSEIWKPFKIDIWRYKYVSNPWYLSIFDSPKNKGKGSEQHSRILKKQYQE